MRPSLHLIGRKYKPVAIAADLEVKLGVLQGLVIAMSYWSIFFQTLKFYIMKATLYYESNLTQQKKNFNKTIFD